MKSENLNDPNIEEEPLYQAGYTQAIKDLRTNIAREYNVNTETVAENLLLYLFRPIDFKNLSCWSKNIFFTSKS